MNDIPPKICDRKYFLLFSTQYVYARACVFHIMMLWEGNKHWLKSHKINFPFPPFPNPNGCVKPIDDVRLSFMINISNFCLNRRTTKCYIERQPTLEILRENKRTINLETKYTRFTFKDFKST